MTKQEEQKCLKQEWGTNSQSAAWSINKEQLFGHVYINDCPGHNQCNTFLIITRNKLLPPNDLDRAAKLPLRCWDLLVCLFADDVSAPLSLPARSISENLPWMRLMPGVRTTIWNTAWDREEFEFADVCPEVLQHTVDYITSVTEEDKVWNDLTSLYTNKLI